MMRDDTPLALDDMAFVEDAYFLTLGRPADPRGLMSCLQRLQSGLPRQKLLHELSVSREARKCLPALATPVLPAHLLAEAAHCTLRKLLSVDVDTFVQLAYLRLLGREADCDGREAYGARLRRGVPRALVLQELQESEEGRRHGATIDGLPAAVQAATRWPARAMQWLRRRRQPEPVLVEVEPDSQSTEARLADRFGPLDDLLVDASDGQPSGSPAAGLTVIIDCIGPPDATLQTMQCLQAIAAQRPLEVVLLRCHQPLAGFETLALQARAAFGQHAVQTVDLADTNEARLDLGPDGACHTAARVARHGLLLWVAPGARLPSGAALARACDIAARPGVASVGFGPTEAGAAFAHDATGPQAGPVVTCRAAFLTPEVRHGGTDADSDPHQRPRQPALRHVSVDSANGRIIAASGVAGAAPRYTPFGSERNLS